MVTLYDFRYALKPLELTRIPCPRAPDLCLGQADPEVVKSNSMKLGTGPSFMQLLGGKWYSENVSAKQQLKGDHS